MSKFGRKQRPPPEGFDYIEGTLDALENELRDKVNESHEGMRKNETQWPIHQINYQRSRYVYDLYYKHHRISKEVYDYCVANKLVDANLIAKWKKQGYEKLCSTYSIDPKNFKFGTVSICRVPNKESAVIIENPVTGCRGCATGSSEENIFGNKYGQNLAAIQIAREEAMERSNSDDRQNDQEEEEDEDEEEDEGPVLYADGSTKKIGGDVWDVDRDNKRQKL